MEASNVTDPDLDSRTLCFKSCSLRGTEPLPDFEPAIHARPDVSTNHTLPVGHSVELDSGSLEPLKSRFVDREATGKDTSAFVYGAHRFVTSYVTGPLDEETFISSAYGRRNTNGEKTLKLTGNAADFNSSVE